MALMDLNGARLNVVETGDPKGAPVVFANSLGTSLELWDPLLPHLPDGLRIIRWDMRGHGASEAVAAPYKMGTLGADAEAVMDALEVKDALFVGLSIGGLIAQGLASKRLDLVRSVVLSNTGAKIGTRTMWDERIALAREAGLGPLADGSMERWFSKGFATSPEVEPWRQMYMTTSVEGFCGCCGAIAGADFITPTSGLRLPALGIAGSEDGSTPPDVVREMTDLIPGSKFALVRGAGHLPHVEKPQEYAALLTGFMRETGHI
jgi:3-oxoadipate enol-lactonase